MKTKATPKPRGTRVPSRPRTPAAKGRAGAETDSETAPAAPDLQIRSILVPIDFSEPSKRALDSAVRFADRFGAKLTLLHVVEPVGAPDFANAFPLLLENDKLKAVCKGRLDLLIKQKAIDPERVEKTLVRQGRSFHEIAEAARTLKADLIVIATHGYTGLKHALLGSTTERVVRHAPCPVLVLRRKDSSLQT